MSDPLFVGLTAAAALACAMMAGFFFAFSTSVMDALGRRPPAEGMAAMQAIYAAVLNPVFFGTGALAVGIGVGAGLQWEQPGAVWLVAGSVVYAVGSLLWTMGLHVPMNETLATRPADAGSTAYWQEYRERWTRWNHVRAAASLTAAVLFAAGLGAHC